MVDAAAEQRLEPGDAGLGAEPESLEDLEPRPEEQGQEALHDVSFVRQARRKAFWRRPAVRAVLALLASRSARCWPCSTRCRTATASRRTAVAAPTDPGRVPAARCSIGSPRQIEAIVIDSSSFSKLRSDAYRLAFTLKNQAAMEVAMPAVELTLTDAQDQPVLRRVLTPADMVAAA